MIQSGVATTFRAQRNIIQATERLSANVFVLTANVLRIVDNKKAQD